MPIVFTFAANCLTRQISYAMKCWFSTLTPIHQDVIVIHAEDLWRDIHGFQNGIHVNLFNFYFCLVKIYNICNKLYKTWLFKSTFFPLEMQTWMIGMLIKPQSFTLYKHVFVFNKSKPVSKWKNCKIEKSFAETSLCLSFTDF